MTIFQLRPHNTEELIKSQIDIASCDGIIFETIHYRKNGTSLWVEVSSINIGDSEKVLLSMIRDISLRKEKEIQFSYQL